MVSTNPKDWGKAYEKKRPLYENFTIKLFKLIKELLESNDIDFAQIEHRTKAVDKFVEKIQREGKDYKDPLIEVTDLSGIRIIVYYLEDVDNIGEMIKKEFEVDKDHSIDKSQAVDPDRFGYLSVHYVVSLAPSRKQLTEWKQYSDLKAEIQVRTICQHAWASISRKVDYKVLHEAPRSLRRQLYRLSALLELADNEFSDLRLRSEELIQQYSGDIDKGSYDIELNLDSLDAYLESSKQHIKWMEIAEEIGFINIQRLNGFSEISKRNLFIILQYSGITTIQGLDAMLNEANEWGKDILTKTFERISEKLNRFEIKVHPYDIITILAVFGRKNYLSRSQILQMVYSEDIKELFLEMTGKHKKKS